jgi:hypothetical protein
VNQPARLSAASSALSSTVAGQTLIAVRITSSSFSDSRRRHRIGTRSGLREIPVILLSGALALMRAWMWEQDASSTKRIAVDPFDSRTCSDLPNNNQSPSVGLANELAAK